VPLEDEGRIVLHLQTQTCYRLNETGSILWAALDAKPERSMADLADHLEDRLSENVHRERIETDVEAFVDAMTGKDLLVRDAPES
jgi:hypothetical protein